MLIGTFESPAYNFKLVATIAKNIRTFFTLQDQFVAQQKHLLRVEVQHADWLIQDGGITTNLLRDKLSV